MNDLKKRSIKGFFWDLFGKFSLQSIGFIISIFLARLLTPEEFGLVGMVMVIIPITQVFMDLGLGAALIQKKEISQELYSSVFWLNIIFGTVFTIILYISADYIAQFYQRTELAGLVKILSFIFFISSFGIVQNIHFTKSLDFKTHTIISLTSSIISGTIGITLAIYNYGILALVYQKLIAIIVSVLSYWLISKWRPSFHFSINDIKSIWGFGSKHFLNGIISAIYSKLDVILIGKMFQASTLGFYTRARSLDTLVNNFSSGSIIRVFFPMISEVQDDLPKVINIYKKLILLVAVIGIGLTSFLYLVANDLFIILFTEKWSKSAHLFKLMAIVGFTYPLSSIMINLILGLGYSGKNLVLGLWKKAIGIVSLSIGFLWGIEAYLYACIAHSLIGIIMNMSYVSKIINISVLSQLKWIYKPLFIALIIVISMEFLIHINNIYVSFAVKGGIFTLTYLFLVYLIDIKIKHLLQTQLKSLTQYVRNRNS